MLHFTQVDKKTTCIIQCVEKSDKITVNVKVNLVNNSLDLYYSHFQLLYFLAFSLELCPFQIA